MNLSMFAVAGAVLVVGAVTLSQADGNARVAVFSPPAPTSTAQERAVLARTVRAEFHDVPVSEVFSYISQTIGVPVNVAWTSLPKIGPDFKVSFTEKNADFATILAELGEDMGSGTGWTLTYRMSDGAIRVATEEYFDRREMVLASYDLSAFANEVSGDQVLSLIRTFVQPNGWVDNGGDLARGELAGSRMFVEAPKRYHVQIQWFIDELSKGAGGGGHAVPARAGALADPDSDAAPSRRVDGAGKPIPTIGR